MLWGKSSSRGEPQIVQGSRGQLFQRDLDRILPASCQVEPDRIVRLGLLMPYTIHVRAGNGLTHGRGREFRDVETVFQRAKGTRQHDVLSDHGRYAPGALAWPYTASQSRQTHHNNQPRSVPPMAARVALQATAQKGPPARALTSALLTEPPLSTMPDDFRSIRKIDSYAGPVSGIRTPGRAGPRRRRTSMAVCYHKIRLPNPRSCRQSFRSERLDRFQSRGPSGGVEAEKDAHRHREDECDTSRDPGDHRGPIPQG